ncbi:uncharacterized protein sall2 isoform X1 [Paramormyrops kingsleyae]|uniref:Sal-like protein 2 n=1 Tax=Paramormyrops kingsleyae TaxID=1676925 RepID=A0A3B3S8Z8_9TELE|nr:sal-like protein 2 isoform X1 [Paramormyrops kingsleyae]
MSRRKQKRPQQLVNSVLGSTRILTQDEQVAVKSLSAFLTADSASSPLLDSQPPLAPCPSPGGLHNPSLPTESFPASRSPNQPAPHPASLSDGPSSHSPDIPYPSLSSQARSPTQHSSSPASSSQSQARSLMASPKMGVSATTTTSSSSSSSSCVPPHPGSPSPVPEGPPSPVTPAPSPGEPPRPHLSIAVILEELRVLQQRQIYQMQMTEEICKQVLQLGGVACGLDSPPLPQLCLEASDGASGPPLPLPTQPSAPPLLACFPSLLPQSVSKAKAPHPMSHVLRPLKPQYEAVGGAAVRAYPGNITRASSSSSSALSSSISSSSSSSTATTSASHYPLSLALGMPPRYLHEKSPNTTSASASGLPFFTPPLPASTSLPGPSQEPQQSGSGGPAGSSLGRLSHACRFCGKLFSSDSSLQIHLRSHTGERPYQCPVCLSRFTTRGNLKVHFLRHREQNPELSLSLLPPSLFGAGSDQTQTAPSILPAVPSVAQKRRKRRSEDDVFGEGSEGGTPVAGFSLGSTPGARPPPATLPLPPSVDLALLSTAHSLLQLNRAAAAAAAAAAVSSGSGPPSSSASSSSSSTISSSSSSPLASIASLYKGAKRFDENTPPHPAMLPHSAYSQLAHLPKLLFPSAPSQHHHPGLALLRPTGPPPPGSHISGPHPQLTFPFSPYPKAQTSSSPSASSSSDTSKLQKLVEKLEKEPQKLPEESQASGSSEAVPNSTTTGTGFSSGLTVTTASSFSREMMAALGVGGGTGVGGLGVVGAGPPNLAPNQCGTCLRVLSCPRALRLHQATHLGERPFPCRLCGRSFSTKGNLRAHQATHRARPPARAHNSCPLCQRKFTNALVLQHHIRMHLGGQLPPGGVDPPPEGSPQAESRFFSVGAGELLGSGPIATSSQCIGSNPFLGGGVTPLSVNIAPLSAEGSNHSPSGSSSPDLVPPADLSPDPTLNPSADPVPLGSSEPPVLSASVPVSSSRVPSSEDSQADLKPSIAPTPTGRSSPAPSSPAKTVLQKHNEGSEATPPRGTKSKQEDPLDTPGPIVTLPILPSSRSPPPGPSPDAMDTTGSEPKSCAEIRASPHPPLLGPAAAPNADPPEPAVEPPLELTLSGTPVLKGDKGLVPEPEAPPTDAVCVGLPKSQGVLAPPAPSRKEAREGIILNSPPRDDGGRFKAVGPDVQITPPSAPRPPEKKTYCCSECGKEYASRSGLKGHMKHHGGVVKTPRQAAPRPPRVASSASAAPTLTPTTGSPVSFWNQYQAFLTNTGDPKEETAPGPANGSQGEDAEMPRLAESPNKPKSREDLQIVSEENRNESVRGTEPEGM